MLNRLTSHIKGKGERLQIFIKILYTKKSYPKTLSYRFLVVDYDFSIFYEFSKILAYEILAEVAQWAQACMRQNGVSPIPTPPLVYKLNKLKSPKLQDPSTTTIARRTTAHSWSLNTSGKNYHFTFSTPTNGTTESRE